MAITKILHINPPEHGSAESHLSNAIQYILNPEKTKDGLLTGSYNCDKDMALQTMLDTKAFYGKMDKRQGYHIVISFSPEETDEKTALDILSRFCRMYLGENYECVYAVHNDQEHMHGHIIFNSVSCLTGRKYHYRNGDWAREIQPITNKLCEEYGLEMINVNEKGLHKYKDYGMWADEKNGQPGIDRDQMRRDIDEAVMASLTMDEVVDYLRLKQYKVRAGTKTMSLTPPGRERGIRTYRLGYAYTPEIIQKRLNGESITPDQYNPPEEMEESPVYIRSAGRHVKGMRGIQNKNQYYAYQTDARQLKRIQRQHNYLVEHNIKTGQELYQRIQKLNAALIELDQERRTVFRDRCRYNDMIHMLNTMGEEEADLELLRQGYDPAQFREYERTGREQLEYLRKMKKAVNLELGLCRDIQISRFKSI